MILPFPHDSAIRWEEVLGAPVRSPSSSSCCPCGSSRAERLCDPSELRVRRLTPHRLGRALRSPTAGSAGSGCNPSRRISRQRVLIRRPAFLRHGRQRSNRLFLCLAGLFDSLRGIVRQRFAGGGRNETTTQLAFYRSMDNAKCLAESKSIATSATYPGAYSARTHPC